MKGLFFNQLESNMIRFNKIRRVANFIKAVMILGRLNEF